MVLVIKRVAMTDKGTFGVLLHEGIPFAVTLERPWADNQRLVSCIPGDVYTCKRVQSPRFGVTFEVTGVMGRSHVLFHKGNRIGDTQGCILVAEEFSKFGEEAGVGDSAKGYAEFMDLLKDQEMFSLSIVEC